MLRYKACRNNANGKLVKGAVLRCKGDVSCAVSRFKA